MGKILLNGVEYSSTANNGVTGIKGNNENEYRTGDVNLTSENIGAVNKTGDTMTGDLVVPIQRASANMSVPCAGRIDSTTLIPQGLSEFKTFLGSIVDESSTFWNIISIRHGNGWNDGRYFGMYMRSLLLGEGSHGGSLLWNKQMGSNKGWLGERVLLDSVNYKDFCLPLSGGTMNNDANVTFKSGNYIVNIRPAEAILSNGNKQIYIMQGNEINRPSIKLIDVDSTYERDESVEINSGFIKITDNNSGEKLQINADSIKTKTTFTINTKDVNNHSLIINGSTKSIYSGIAISDEKYNLGTSNRKWNDIYAQNGVIQTSDRTTKTDINNLETQKAQAFINGLNPVSYKMIDGTSGRTHYGFIAQDVEELMNALHMDSKDFAGFIKSPKKVIKYEDENGIKLENPVEEVLEGEYNYSLRYDEFIAPLIKVVQEQQKEIENQQQQITQLKNALENANL